MATLIVLLASYQCFFEVGVGQWIVKDEAPNGVPTEINLYCESGRWEVGYYHLSDVTRGFPFNDREELSIDRVMIKYRVPLW